MTIIYKKFKFGLAGLAACAALSVAPVHAETFRAFLDAMRAEAVAQGVPAELFDRETRDLTPDLTLPDLALPGRAPRGDGQAEFALTPAQYLSEKAIAGAAAQGRALATKHAAALDAIERRFGVPGGIVLAIWARETGYGAAQLKYDALRSTGTLAWVGRRKETFHDEFLAALKILADGEVPRAAMKSSWAGAMGLPQALPSQFLRYGVDMDGDGRRDIWRSVPDALGTIANHLVGEGWKPGLPWAYEVRPPAGAACTEADPDVKHILADWIRKGFHPVTDIPPHESRAEASLLMPAGPYGPAFLVTSNYFVLKQYNYADLYVLYVGHLADRIAGEKPFATPWRALTQPSGAALAAAQERLTALGLYADKIDGKAGMKTRLAIGRFQERAGLSVDCWPNAQTLAALGQGR